MKYNVRRCIEKYTFVSSILLKRGLILLPNQCKIRAIKFLFDSRTDDVLFSVSGINAGANAFKSKHLVPKFSSKLMYNSSVDITIVGVLFFKPNSIRGSFFKI